MINPWEVKPETIPEEHFIHLIYKPEENSWWTEAIVKSDGCINFKKAFNSPFPDAEDTDYLHICDLDEMIYMLLKLREIARGHFKDKENWEF